MPSKAKSVVVTVADDALDSIQDVARRLTAKGLKVERVLPVTGVISGSCASNCVSSLRRVEGVLSVEDEAVADLPPPGSSPQ